ncbi:MAG: hypothetical protein ACJAT4_001106 [Granulosicoccus sp.]|jgi:hypothetical protein
MKKTFLFFTLLTLIAFSSCDNAGKDFDKDFDKDKWDKDYDKDKEACIELVYPISYTMPDGVIISGDEEAIETEMKAWYLANPISEEKPILSYPVEYIILLTDETKTAENEDELLFAKKDCYEIEEMESCSWDEATEASGTSFEKFVIKELQYNADCDCVYEGYEKFVENGKTKFLIIYGSDDCVGYGYKVTCENGDCEDGDKCKFLQDCEEY